MQASYLCVPIFSLWCLVTNRLIKMKKNSNWLVFENFWLVRYRYKFKSRSDWKVSTSTSKLFQGYYLDPPRKSIRGAGELLVLEQNVHKFPQHSDQFERFSFKKKRRVYVSMFFLMVWKPFGGEDLPLPYRDLFFSYLSLLEGNSSFYLTFNTSSQSVV